MTYHIHYIKIKILFIYIMQDPHHVYLDLDVINNNHTPGGSPPYLRVEEIKNMHVLDGDNSEYFCSIVRFTMQN